MRVLATFAVVLVLSSVLVSADISEFFLRDPYDQLDLFRRSKPASQSEKGKEVSTDPEDDDELVEDYLDYLMDVGALPSTDKDETEEKEKKSKEEEETKKLRPRKGPYEVGDDVLAAVKQPFTPNRRMSSYKKKQSSRRIASGNHIQDNIALESSMPVPVRRRKPQYAQPQPPMRRRSDEIKKPVMSHQKSAQGQADLPGLENVERLIPSSLKTVIEDSGKRIVKAVMKPINAASRPRNTHIKETSFSSKMESWLQPYRTYFGYMAPTFAPAHITTFLVTQWVSTIAITFAWITVGYMYNTMIAGRRSNEGRSSQEPWEYLVPDSDTVSTVLRDLSDAAQRWHDEL